VTHEDVSTVNIRGYDAL